MSAEKIAARLSAPAFPLASNAHVDLALAALGTAGLTGSRSDLSEGGPGVSFSLTDKKLISVALRKAGFTPKGVGTKFYAHPSAPLVAIRVSDSGRILRKAVSRLYVL